MQALALPCDLDNRALGWGLHLYGETNMDALVDRFIEMVKRGEYIVDTDKGGIYSTRRGRMKRVGFVTSTGHMSILIDNRPTVSIQVHRAIWTFANGPIPDGLVINHINGVKTDNRLANLECVTRTQNVRHAIHVLKKKRKLPDEDIREIRRLSATGQYSQRQLAEMFGVHQSNISVLLANKIWKGI